MIKIDFYSTLDCHLCDDAEHLLNLLISSPTKAIDELDITLVDVAKSDDLLELYGIRIPVIKRTDNNEELGWPFDLEELSKFLS